MSIQQRHIGRERAVQALFSLEQTQPGDVRQGLEHFWNSIEDDTGRVAKEFAEQLVRGVAEHRDALDEAIQAQSENWRVERMARIDRNVLRVGAYELIHTETPARVVISGRSTEPITVHAS